MDLKQLRPCLLILLIFSILFSALPCFAAGDGEEESEEWKYGRISGQVRMFYFLQEESPEGDSFDRTKESFAIGGQLRYETPWLADHFGGVVNGFLAAPLFDGLNRERYAGGGLLNDKNHGFAVVGEAYFKARYGKTEARLFRQRMETPIVNGNDSRILPNTFEAYGLESRDIENLVLRAAWVDKIKKRDSDDFISMTQAAGISNENNGLIMLGADWSPTDALGFRVWNYYAPDLYNTLFFQTDYSYQIGERLETHVQVQGISQQHVGDNLLGNMNSLQGGLRWGVSFSGLTLDIGGTIVDDTDDVRYDWGANPFFNSLMSSDFNRAGEKALFLAATYDFSTIGIEGFSANFKAGFGDTPDTGKNASYDRNEYNLNLSYDFGEYLEGLSLLNRWEYQDADRSMGGRDVAQVRVRLQYDF